MFDWRDYGNGIIAFDAGYVRPVLAAIHLVIENGRVAFIDTGSNDALPNAKAALQRTESRGGHTRDDHPDMDANWRNTLLVCKTTDVATSEAMVPRVTVVPETQVPMRPDLLEVFELSELEKYYTEAELTERYLKAQAWV